MIKENKEFTPGPWHQSHRKTKDGMYSTEVYTEDGETIATMHWYPMPIDKNGMIGTYRNGNAILTAEAPAMLKALEMFINDMDTKGCYEVTAESTAVAVKLIEKLRGKS